MFNSVLLLVGKEVQPALKDKDKTSFERRMELLSFVMRNQGITTIEIAKKFSVSRTTLHKDLIFLGRYAPIYTKSGSHGGVYILEEYKQEILMYLSKEEESLLREIMKSRNDKRECLLLNRIINRYSMPTIRR